MQLKRAGEDRELENKDFQSVVADQRETQKLLEAALAKLKGFYDKAFVQTGTKHGQPAGPPPPPSFKKSRRAAAGRTQLLANFGICRLGAISESCKSGKTPGKLLENSWKTPGNSRTLVHFLRANHGKIPAKFRQNIAKFWQNVAKSR